MKFAAAWKLGWKEEAIPNPPRRRGGISIPESIQMRFGRDSGSGHGYNPLVSKSPPLKRATALSQREAGNGVDLRGKHRTNERVKKGVRLVFLR